MLILVIIGSLENKNQSENKMIKRNYIKYKYIEIAEVIYKNFGESEFVFSDVSKLCGRRIPASVIYGMKNSGIIVIHEDLPLTGKTKDENGDNIKRVWRLSKNVLPFIAQVEA